MNRSYIAIYFDDDASLLKAVNKLNEKKEIILDVFSPFPVHGMDAALKMKRTRIPIGGFIFGALGALTAFGFQTWVFTTSYPLVIGGKPFLSAPAFIPITFELTVLFGGIAMATALLVRSKLNPDTRFKPLDTRITDDRFVVLVEAAEKETAITRINEILSDISPREVVFQNG